MSLTADDILKKIAESHETACKVHDRIVSEGFFHGDLGVPVPPDHPFTDMLPSGTVAPLPSSPLGLADSQRVALLELQVEVFKSFFADLSLLLSGKDPYFRYLCDKVIDDLGDLDIEKKKLLED